MKLESQTSELVLQRAKELNPWHFDFEIAPGVLTTSLNDPEHPDPDLRYIKSVDPEEMVPLLEEYFPSGLAGKDVLDVGCNSGGYCFIAHRMGARSVTGIDARSHWIEQAEWIKSLFYPEAGASIRFETTDIRKFLEREAGRFDLVLFKGVFYHLADPIATLLDLCDATREVMLIDTASSDTIPEHCLAPITESTTHAMSGLDGLAWLPGGPAALRPLFIMKGFQSIQKVFWRHGVTAAGWGRFRLAASRLKRIEGFVDHFTSPNIVAGWVRQEGYEGSLQVSAQQNGVKIGTAESGLQRKSGNVGFAITLTQSITWSQIASGEIRVCCLDTDSNLRDLRVWPTLLKDVKHG